jgi:hypothetical protein
LPRKKKLVDVKSLARSHTAGAIKTLSGLMNSRECPEASRVAAAVALLDRGHGRPKQTTELEGGLDEIRITIRNLTDKADK